MASHGERADLFLFACTRSDDPAAGEV